MHRSFGRLVWRGVALRSGTRELKEESPDRLQLGGTLPNRAHAKDLGPQSEVGGVHTGLLMAPSEPDGTSPGS